MNMPPVNDKGAETISAPSSNRILIDFCSWTLKVDDPLKALELSGFDVGLFTDTSIGGMGYRKSLRYQNIVVFYDGNEGMGCHISMTGKGCRQYEQLMGGKPHLWDYLFKDVIHAGGTFTRLDLAIDNVDGRLSLARLRHAVETKSIRTRFKRYREFREGTLSRTSKEKTSETIQLGSVESRLLIRFYDKATEQEKKHDLEPGSLGRWVRCELLLRAERAQEAVRHVLNGVEIPRLAVSALNTYMAVVKVTSENLSQCKMRRWWSSWLNCTEKIKLTCDKAVKYVLDIMQHVERQYSATFAMFKKHLGVASFHDFVGNLVDIGKDKMTKKHQLILSQSSYFGGELPF